MKENEQIKPQSKTVELWQEQMPSKINYLILKRELVCGCSREQAKERWGPIFNERAWNDLVQAKAQEQKSDIFSKASLSALPKKDSPDLDRE